ncbi:MAG TPA: hypothetical protein VKG26_12980 [Bacteroidia bacterium]|nr:hypothetical protein [Bacteroidia bacterium]
MAIINISEKFTGFILLRYFAQENIEGLCSIHISAQTKEQINLAHTLYTVADEHINALSSIKCIYEEEVKSEVFFFPNKPISYFSNDPKFIEEYKEGKNCWHIHSIEKTHCTASMPTEVLYVECSKSYFYFTGHPYPNSFVSSIITTAGANYDMLGIL